jgi:hypothetical protein
MVHLSHIRTTRKTIVSHSAMITANDIRKAFDLPEKARIVFEVPSGGDYSSCALDIEEYPLRVSWEVHSE